MRKPQYYSASDYAGLDCKNASFYYGYEHSICAECGQKNRGEYCDTHDADRYWCFTAKLEGMSDEIVIPYNKLQADCDMFDCQGCLMSGIGWILTKYKIDFSR